MQQLEIWPLTGLLWILRNCYFLSCDSVISYCGYSFKSPHILEIHTEIMTVKWFDVWCILKKEVGLRWNKVDLELIV